MTEVLHNVDNFPKYVHQLSADKTAAHTRIVNDPNLGQLHWAAVGLCKESAEVLDTIFRHIFYNEPLDEIGVVDELGDIMYHLQTIFTTLGVSIEHAKAACVAKNMVRYPDDKFEESNAAKTNRNRTAEHDAVVDAINTISNIRMDKRIASVVDDTSSYMDRFFKNEELSHMSTPGLYLQHLLEDKLHITYDEAAEKTGLDHATLLKIINNEIRITIDTADKLALLDESVPSSYWLNIQHTIENHE